MYFQGVSTRKVAAVLEELGGFSLSATTVSKVAAELEEQIEAFRSRPLDHCRWPYLVVDARYEKVRRAKRIVSVAVLLVLGVNDRGRREILTWRISDSESEDSWRQIFVELVTADAHKGIRAAMDRDFPGVEWQRCLSAVHYGRRVGCTSCGRCWARSHTNIGLRLPATSVQPSAARAVPWRWRRHERWPSGGQNAHPG